MINAAVDKYNNQQISAHKAICDSLCLQIQKGLPDAENKLWHGSPVWFLDGNPVVGYAVRKNDVQLLFWSGQTFGESGLKPTGSFKAAEARYTRLDQIDNHDLLRWLKLSQTIQWDYKNIIKRRGVLERL